MMPRPSIYYNDNCPQVCAWIQQLMFDGLIPYGVVDSRSILDVQPADLEGFTQCHFFCGIAGWAYALKLAGWPATRPVWTGSPPCQPFSAAGKLEGKNDARHLAPHFISLVGACRPPVLFGEQVASAAVFGKSAKRVGGEPEWVWVDDLSDRLEAARYAVGASDIPAAGVGAPHIRQRTFFGAVRLDDSTGSGRCWGEQVEDKRHSESRGPDKIQPERLEHTAGNGWQQRGAEPSGRGLDAGCGTERPADADDQRLQGRDGKHSDPGGRQETSRHSGSCSADLTLASAGPSSTDHGGWDDVDWLFCRDGKWRPVKSSVQRVADGLPGSVVPCSNFVPASSPLAQSTKEARRVMRLRGYGNAIVPQAAALFIKAFDKTVNTYREAMQTYEQPDDPWDENALTMHELNAFDFNVEAARTTLAELTGGHKDD
jgi:DNA (cytosine-5)-methyltransferase 1